MKRCTARSRGASLGVVCFASVVVGGLACSDRKITNVDHAPAPTADSAGASSGAGGVAAGGAAGSSAGGSAGASGDGGNGGALPAATHEIVIYGCTSAAIIAAVQARRLDKSVIVLCPEQHLGGLSA